MNQHHPGTGKSLLAVLLAVTLAAGSTLPAAAKPMGSNMKPSYDEAYYGTLDHYGNLVEGSVVKSYTLNGADSLTDHGVYDEVVNLTDGTAPVTKGDTATFRFKKNAAPSHFYFEGKTAAPFAALPWTISVAYTLNGVPAEAEDLAGKTGVVEIIVDAVPNPAASEYAKNNYTLETAAMFNQDDILSLEADGAQVQLIGNLRVVLFAGLPGETGHWVIRVGAEDFSFDGLTFLLVPATLGQLKEISKLSQRKDDLESDYHKLSGSMDDLLNSFASLGGSLRETADGLDELNHARETISNGKGQLYDQGDKVLEDLGKLHGSLGTLPGHLDSADQAVDDLTGSLGQVTDSAVALQGHLRTLESCISDLQKDLDRIKHNSGDLEDNLDQLGHDLDRLRHQLGKTGSAAEDLDLQVNGGALQGLPEEVQENIRLHGISLEQILQVQKLWAGLDKQDGKITFPVFLSAAQMVSGQSGEPDPMQLMLLEKVYRTAVGDGGASVTKPMDQQEFYAAMQMLMEIQGIQASPDLSPEQKQAAVAGVLTDPEKQADYVKNAKAMIKLEGQHDMEPVIGMMGEAAALLDHMGSDGLAGNLSTMVQDMSGTIGTLDGTAEAGRALIRQLDDVLTQVDGLRTTVDGHVPGLHQTLRDTRTLVSDMVTGVDDTHGFLTAFRALARTSGQQLDAGTKKSLHGLADTLRRTAGSTDAVSGVKTAKDVLSGIVEDTWREYTGDVNNILLMDPTAEAQSLTSAENPAPTSVQVLLRTQEIKEAEPEEEKAEAKKHDSPSFWDRIKQMFLDLAHAFTGIFH